MPTFGRSSPSGQLYGGSKHVATIVLESLLSARGSAYTSDDTSAIYAKCAAAAREIAYAWAAAHQLVFLWDANYTPFLARWEAILGVRPSMSSTDAERRAAVAVKLFAFSVVSTHHRMTAVARDSMPGCVVALTRDAANAAVAISSSKPRDMAQGVFEGYLAAAFAALDEALPVWVSLPGA